jgi:branched-chain amino acid transport system ATP-binding protein
MAERVKRLRDEGLVVLVVEHNMRFVREVADNLVVLNFGEVIYSGGVAEGLADRQVVDAYLGTGHNETGEADAAL